MGLTIYYRMKAKVDANRARRLIERLHSFVSTLSFDEVSPILEYEPPDGKRAYERGPDLPPYLKPGSRYLERKRQDGLTELVHVHSRHVVYFNANLNGSETASFGLATHPPVVVHFEDVVSHPSDCGEDRVIGAGAPIEFKTRLDGWYSWSHCCKTQYASNPKLGGVENFLRAHHAVFAAIDECKRLGMTTHIRDDAKYWRHRNDAKLVAELNRWNELIAGFAGRLGDKLGNAPGALVAPIKNYPDFERLEAKGDEHFREMHSPKKTRKRPKR